jgi:hypothetical protein
LLITHYSTYSGLIPPISAGFKRTESQIMYIQPIRGDIPAISVRFSKGVSNKVKCDRCGAFGSDLVKELQTRLIQHIRVKLVHI